MSARRRIAVVPAYNEERTVLDVLETLSALVDELIVVDDGSVDSTRAKVQGWLSHHPHARLLTFDENRGMSAAYYLAFGDIARRIATGEIAKNDLVLSVDADGQHDLAALDRLARVMVDEDLDAVLAQRDLSDYPLVKRVGNSLISSWASLWAGHRLCDVESGYRIFRASALADALAYYQGWKYSETVEVAVVLCRLGYRVRNDILVDVPVFRSRTSYFDALVDVVVIPRAAWRVLRRRRGLSLAVDQVGRPVQ